MRKHHYNAVPGEDGEEGVEEDLELGEGPGLTARHSDDGHEEGVITTTNNTSITTSAPAATKSQTLEEEVDNWDEHADDDAWDEDDGDIGAATSKDASAKRAD